MRKTLIIIASIALFYGCSSTGKTHVTNTALDDLMQKKTVEMAIRTAEPMVTQAMAQIANSGLLQPGNNISRIDLSGQGYFIKIVGDSVSANLPYYGERQMGGGYNANTGIVFEGITDDLEITKNDKNASYSIQFSTSDTSETFNVTTVIGTQWNSSTDIQSSHRTRIRYSGKVSETKKPNN